MSIFSCHFGYTDIVSSTFLIDAIKSKYDWVEEIHIMQDPAAAGYIMQIKARDDFDYRWVVEDF